MDYRLLVVSSRARNKLAIFNSVLPNLVLVDYNYEGTTLEDLLSKISKALNGTKVASMAFVLHTSERELFICAPGSAFVSLKTLINDSAIKSFFAELANNMLDLVRKLQKDYIRKCNLKRRKCMKLKAFTFGKIIGHAFRQKHSQKRHVSCRESKQILLLDKLLFYQHFQSNWSCRLDFLATYAAVNLDGALIAKEITALIGCQVGLSRDLFGSGLEVKIETPGKAIPVGELYFDINKLRAHLQNVGKVGKEGAKKLLK